MTQSPNNLRVMLKTLLISPCHYRFGGWFRADNIARRLKGRLIYPQRPERLSIRLLRGFLNGFKILRYPRVYIFELMPETLFPGLLGLLLRKDVILDIADEWLYSPTYLRGNLIVRFLVDIIDKWTIKLFPKLTVTSEYLVNKYDRGLKLINGVNRDEFVPVDRKEARRCLGLDKDIPVIVAFGNTFGNQRKLLLDHTSSRLREILKVKIFLLQGLSISQLAIYLGASDLVLFPTGDSPCEKACFPIRVGTALNAERVIATDDSDTEFHNTLKKYDCMVLGNSPKELAGAIKRYFTSAGFRKKLNENVLKAKQELDWDKIINGYSKLLV